MVPVHVHSKVLICDDLYAIVGSGNLNARSFTNDAEVGLGVTGPSVRDLRRRLWSEHSAMASEEHWQTDFGNVTGRVSFPDSLVERYETSQRLYPPGPLQRRWWQLSETSRRDRQ